MKPTFIGIGAQKCASTWVHRVLADHPEACVSEPKELDFFSYRFDHGFQWYESHFAACAGRRAVGEVSPSYFHDSAAPQRAARYAPGLRIVVTLRDPIERAYSNHLHEVRVGHLSGGDLSFESALPNNPMYLEQSRYATHLARWLDLFPREQVLVLLQEEIAVDPAATARLLFRFLGIDPAHQPAALTQRVNESATVKNARLDALFKSLGRAARRAGLESWVTLAKRSAVVERIRAENKLDLRQQVPPMREETRDALAASFADELHGLARLLGRSGFPWPTWQSLTGRSVGSSERAPALIGQA